MGEMDLRTQPGCPSVILHAGEAYEPEAGTARGRRLALRRSRVT